MITASSAKRAYTCGASHAFPPVIESGDAAERGNAIHDFLDMATLGERDEAIEKYRDSDYLPEMLKIDVPGILAGVDVIETEQAFAVNVFTGRVKILGDHINRNYPKFDEDGWICGSEDYIGSTGGHIADGGMVVANDYKTGDWCGPVIENLQVGFFAYALSKFYGKTDVQGRITYIQNGAHRIESAIFTPLETDLVLARLRHAYKNVNEAVALVRSGQTPPVYPSAECKWCTGRYSCPKWKGLLQVFLAGELTPDTFPEAYATFKQIKQLVREGGEAFNLFVDSSPAPVILPTGYRLKRVEQSRSSINGKRALALAKEYGATDEELQSCLGDVKFKRLVEVKA